MQVREPLVLRMDYPGHRCLRAMLPRRQNLRRRAGIIQRIYRDFDLKRLCSGKDAEP
jgi:hypothetical protein